MAGQKNPALSYGNQQNNPDAGTPCYRRSQISTSPTPPGSGLKQIHRPNRHILVAAPFVFLILNNGELHWLALRQIGHIRQPNKLRRPLPFPIDGSGIKHHAHTGGHRHRADGCSDGARGAFDKIPPIRLGILLGRNVFLGHNCGGSSSVFKESSIRRLNLPCNSKRLPQETTGDNHQC